MSSNTETYLAEREGREHYHREAYFQARPHFDTPEQRRAFEAGFKRGHDAGFDAAIGAHGPRAVHAVGAQEAQEAMRYRWVRQHFLCLATDFEPKYGGEVEVLKVWPRGLDRNVAPRLVDDAIDRAMAKWGDDCSQPGGDGVIR